MALYANAVGNNGVGVQANASGSDSAAFFTNVVGDYGTGVSVRASATGSTGVYGSAIDGNGLEGHSGSGYGVLGYSSSSTGVFGIGEEESNLYFMLKDTYHAGIWADSGESNGSSLGGLIATADDNNAAFMENDSGSYPTLYLDNGGSGGVTQAKTTSTLLRAVNHYGSCTIGGTGDLTCTGQMKTLATTGAAHKVETYAMQSPENWMEDFGSATLDHGTATVTIDAAFAETANTGTDYHVFLTPNGDSRGLFIAAKTATSFQVRESGGGSASLSFDYRIVAKRKGFEAQRLADVTERFNADAARDAAMERHRTSARPSAPVAPHRPGGFAPAVIPTSHRAGN